MGIFSATMKASRTAMIGGAVGGGVAAFSSGFDQQSTIGGAMAGALAGGVGGAMAGKMMSRSNTSVMSGMQKAGSGLSKAGAAVRSAGLQRISSNPFDTFRGTAKNMFARSAIRSGNVLQSAGLGLQRNSVNINKTGNMAMLALGTGAAGYIGGSIMESNQGSRRYQRKRTAMYGS